MDNNKDKNIDNFDDEFENLFEGSADEFGFKVTEDSDISSTDPETLDLNSYFSDDEISDVLEEKDNEPKPKKKSKGKTAVKIILKSILAIILICIMVGCVAVGGFVGYVLIFVDGTMEEDLNMLKLNYSTTIYVEDENGEWVEYQRLHGAENRIWVPYDKDKAQDDKAEYYGIPQNLADAFVAIEDKRFFDHEGVDWRRTAGAFVNMVTKKTTSGYGGSSITQQLIKNLTKDSDRSANRKIREIMRARYLESNYSKEVILECYMNTIPMGNGLYGVEVASEYYFGKNVNELTLAECASIAGITNIPEYYRPDKNPENNIQRRNLVLSLMLEQGLITKKEYNQAKSEKLVVVGNKAALKEETINNYFVDALIDDVVVALMDKYDWERERAEANFYNGGYKIYATIDPHIQTIMEDVYTDETYALKGKNDEPLQGSMVVLDYEGHILGMVGGMGEKTENRGLNRATMSPRQPGSTIKPLSAYAPAIEKNLITYSSFVDDKETYYNTGSGKWRPVNWYRYYKGNVSVKYALEISMNTIPVYLVDLMTREASYEFLTESLGLTHLTKWDADYSPLGMGGTNGGYTTLESAAAFAVFGNLGKYYEPVTFTHIYDQYDNLIIENIPESQVAVSEDTAYIMNKLLQNVVTGREGTGAGAKKYLPEFDFYAKTGTANDTNDIWFVGGTPHYVASSWCGYDQVQGVSDSKRARTMWGEVMKRIHEGLDTKKEFPTTEHVQCKLYCPETGLIARENCPATAYGWYKTTDKKYCTAHDGDVIKASSVSAINKYLNDKAEAAKKEEEEKKEEENKPQEGETPSTPPGEEQGDNAQNDNEGAVPTD